MSENNMVVGAEPRRVLHFVTGGFSGATQVAVDLCLTAQAGTQMEAMLVLRRKRNTDAARVEAIRARGLRVEVISGWSHLATIWALYRLCLDWRPDVLVAHGFPEHLIGRWAGLLAKVPKLVQVEHNSRERYTRWKLAQSRWLAARSARLVAVSEGVRARLLALGMPAEKTLAIPNGVDLRPYAEGAGKPFEERIAGLVMSARFARQKDHLTLIRALGLLKARGLRLPLQLAGAGKAAYRARAEAEVKRLGLEGQVRFLGHHGGMPELLMSQAVCVLATHYEGMPLALVEGMAAGCACIASDVPGVSEVLEPDRTGLLVPEGDATALADAIERVFCEPGLGQRLASGARERALAEHGVELMRLRYQALLTTL